MSKKWFNLTIEETAKELETDLEKGLSSEDVVKRREKYGSNELKAKKKKSLLVKFLEQFKDFMIIVLIIAAIVSGIVGGLLVIAGIWYLHRYKNRKTSRLTKEARKYRKIKGED